MNALAEDVRIARMLTSHSDPTSSSGSADPLLEDLCARWHRQQALADDGGIDRTDEEQAPFYDALIATEHRIAETPATTRRGARAKLQMATENFRNGLCPSTQGYASDALLLSALDDALRLLT